MPDELVYDTLLVATPGQAAAVRPAFERFAALYTGAFPDPNDREDPSAWIGRLAPTDEEQPVTRLLLAGSDLESARAPAVYGGIVFEYYRASRCGLLAYLVVDEPYRRHGIARRLVREAVAEMEREALGHGVSLQGVFAEAVDFRTVDDPEAQAYAAQRLTIHTHLGARWIAIPYVMPALGEGKTRVTNQVLLTFQSPALNPLSIDREVVASFLFEYYRSLGVEDPVQDADFREMIQALNERSREHFERYVVPDRVPLFDVPQLVHPTLKLREVAVCLHVVTVEADEAVYEPVALPAAGGGADPETGADGAIEAARRALGERLASHFETPGVLGRIGVTRLQPADAQPYDCPVFHSFEIDILSYRFQERPPMASVCAWEAQRRVRIAFPREVTYVAEGHQVTLYAPAGTVEARVALTYTRFPETGVRIWHLTFLPPDGETFSEFDLIRLVQLYYSEQEQTNILSGTRFCIDDEPDLPFNAFLYALSDGGVLSRSPDAGTIEFNPAVDDAVPWQELFSTLFGTTEDDQEAYRALEALYGQPAIRNALNAVCGIVSGHFDYNRMSFSEMQDTLVPGSAAGSMMTWFHRGTLASIDLLDEMHDRCRYTIGISPYLILPHAVLLHNEFVVDHAEELIDRVEDARSIRRMSRVRRTADERLRQAYVPNVFHYSGERELYDVGSRSRGSAEKRDVVIEKLNILRDRLDDYSERSAGRRNHFFAGALAFLSAISVLSAIEFFWNPRAQEALRRWPPSTEVVVMGVVVLALIVFFVLSLPRLRDPGR